MIFTVTYRDKSGALQEIRVDAESRSACASELKHRGIVAVAIQEGKKGSGAAKHKAKAPHNSFWVSRSAKVALFILTILLAACGIWWWMRSNPADNKGAPHKKHEKAKTPAKTHKPIVPNVPQGNEAPVGSLPLAEETNKLQGVKVPIVPPAITNYMVGITITTNKPKNIFRSATEKMLYSLFSTPLGNPPPPMGRIPLRDKKDLESILQNAFDQGSDKDEKRREMEQTVDAARKVFKDYIAQGGKPDEFMEYFRDELAKYHEHWKMSQKLAVAACRDEDPEVARQMVDEINARLAEKGIKPVNIPPKFRERIGLEPVGKEGEAHK